ncbi:MAG: hypothetical protein WA895_05875 [Streptosporangiaceae bacterium]
MTGQSRGNALDHVIVVVFENRSLDNVLGRLYGPGDGKTFEGVLGKDLTNPIPRVGRARCRPQGGAVRSGDRYGHRVHPGTDPRAERPGPRVRRIRSLVLQDALGLGRALSTLGKAAFNGIHAYAEQNNIKIEGLPADPQAEIPPAQALHVIHNFLAIQFPLLHPANPGLAPRPDPDVRQP